MVLLRSLAVAILVLCRAVPGLSQGNGDSLALVRMVEERAAAMNHRDLETIQRQYGSDITFINVGGFYLTAGDMARFDSVLFASDSTRYRASRVHVRMLDSTNAVVYYSWQVDRYRAVNPILNEIGLMTLSAQKRRGQWKWVAITNQSTPLFVDDLLKHRLYRSPPRQPPNIR